MSNNTESNNINNNIEIEGFINEPATPRLYTVHVASTKGHTTYAELEIDQAVEAIADTVEKTKQFAYINGQPFSFIGSDVRSEENLKKLSEALTASEDTEVLLTGKLVGGLKRK